MPNSSSNFNFFPFHLFFSHSHKIHHLKSHFKKSIHNNLYPKHAPYLNSHHKSRSLIQSHAIRNLNYSIDYAQSHSDLASYCYLLSETYYEVILYTWRKFLIWILKGDRSRFVASYKRQFYERLLNYIQKFTLSNNTNISESKIIVLDF